MEQYIVGIDLGGMGAKGALFSLDGGIICEEKIKTNAQDGFEKTVQSLADLAKRLCQKANVDFGKVQAIGVGSPGVVDSGKGTPCPLCVCLIRLLHTSFLFFGDTPCSMYLRRMKPLSL